MRRLVPLDFSTLTPEQKRIADTITAGRRKAQFGIVLGEDKSISEEARRQRKEWLDRGFFNGAHDVWLRVPGFADPAQRLGEHCRFDTGLGKLGELAIVMTGKHWRCQDVFWSHGRIAQSVGLSAEVIEAIRVDAEPPFQDEGERIVYDFLSEYFQTNRVSEPKYARAVELLGENGVINLVAATGYYSLISMIHNVFQLELPEGEEPPFPDE